MFSSTVRLIGIEHKTASLLQKLYVCIGSIDILRTSASADEVSRKFYSALKRKETRAPSAEVIESPNSSFHGSSSAASTLSSCCIKRIVT